MRSNKEKNLWTDKSSDMVPYLLPSLDPFFVVAEMTVLFMCNVKLMRVYNSESLQPENCLSRSVNVVGFLSSLRSMIWLQFTGILLISLCRDCK